MPRWFHQHAANRAAGAVGVPSHENRSRPSAANARANGAPKPDVAPVGEIAVLSGVPLHDSRVTDHPAARLAAVTPRCRRSSARRRSRRRLLRVDSVDAGRRLGLRALHRTAPAWCRSRRPSGRWLASSGRRRLRRLRRAASSGAVGTDRQVRRPRVHRRGAAAPVGAFR